MSREREKGGRWLRGEESRVGGKKELRRESCEGKGAEEERV